MEKQKKNLETIAREDGGYVVTLVPNFLGFHGWIMKRFLREVYDGHVLISDRQLRELHENAGVETLFCAYCRQPVLIDVAERREVPLRPVIRRGAASFSRSARQRRRAVLRADAGQGLAAQGEGGRRS